MGTFFGVCQPAVWTSHVQQLPGGIGITSTYNDSRCIPKEVLGTFVSYRAALRTTTSSTLHRRTRETVADRR